jgi:integrase
MSALRQTLADYLAVHRALGYKLERAEKLLGQFLDYLHDEDAYTVAVEHALAWATAPAGDPWWHALRLNAVRPFAVYLHARDPRHEVPQAGLIRYGSSRATPYLYSPTQIGALVTTARRLPFPLHAVVYPILIGLLAVTGMRVGEALALQGQDVDAQQGNVMVRDGKFGKSRLLPRASEHYRCAAALPLGPQPIRPRDGGQGAVRLVLGRPDGPLARGPNVPADRQASRCDGQVGGMPTAGSRPPAQFRRRNAARRLPHRR